MINVMWKMLQSEIEMNMLNLKITVNDFFCGEASLGILHHRRRFKKWQIIIKFIEIYFTPAFIVQSPIMFAPKIRNFFQISLPTFYFQ